MADVYMQNYQASRVDSPSTKIGPGDQGGKLKVAYDELDLANVGGALALNDVLKGPVLPPNARVHEVILEGPNAGANGALEVGHPQILDGSGNELHAADSNAFMDALSLAGAAAIKKMTDNAGLAGHLKKFDRGAELPIELNVTQAFAAQVGIVKVAVHYTVD